MQKDAMRMQDNAALLHSFTAFIEALHESDTGYKKSTFLNQ